MMYAVEFHQLTAGLWLQIVVRWNGLVTRQQHGAERYSLDNTLVILNYIYIFVYFTENYALLSKGFRGL